MEERVLGETTTMGEGQCRNLVSGNSMGSMRVTLMKTPNNWGRAVVKLERVHQGVS